MPEVGVATQKFSGALSAPVAEPPFLNSRSATVKPLKATSRT